MTHNGQPEQPYVSPRYWAAWWTLTTTCALAGAGLLSFVIWSVIRLLDVLVGG